MSPVRAKLGALEDQGREGLPGQCAGEPPGIGPCRLGKCAPATCWRVGFGRGSEGSRGRPADVVPASLRSRAPRARLDLVPNVERFAGHPPLAVSVTECPFGHRRRELSLFLGARRRADAGLGFATFVASRRLHRTAWEGPRSGMHIRPRAEFAWLVFLFVLSRLAIWLGTDVSFDLRPGDLVAHHRSAVVARRPPAQRLLHPGATASFYNLLLGIVLKLARDERTLRATFMALFSGLSLGSTVLLYDLLRRWQVAPVLRACLSAGVALTPAVILYESLPYYTGLVSFLLLLIVWLFQRCAERFSLGRASGLWFAVAGLIFVRSLFQLAWFVVLVAAACWLVRGHTRLPLQGRTHAPRACARALRQEHTRQRSLRHLVMARHERGEDGGAPAASLSAHGAGARRRAFPKLALSDTTYDPPDKHPELFAATPKTGVRSRSAVQIDRTRQLSPPGLRCAVRTCAA